MAASYESTECRDSMQINIGVENNVKKKVILIPSYIYFPLSHTQEILNKFIISQFLKKYLQYVLAARILTVDFVVFTLAVKKKKIRAGFNLSDRTIPLSDSQQFS
jgi:hypothetical protein